MRLTRRPAIFYDAPSDQGTTPPSPPAPPAPAPPAAPPAPPAAPPAPPAAPPAPPPPPPASEEPGANVSAGLRNLIERSGGERAAATILFQENYQLREARRQAEEALTAFRALGYADPAKLKERITELEAREGALRAMEAQTALAASAATAATAAGVDKDALVQLLGFTPGLTVTVEKVGATDTAFIVSKGGDGKEVKTELHAYADAHWAWAKSSLVPAAGGKPAPAAGRKLGTGQPAATEQPGAAAGTAVGKVTGRYAIPTPAALGGKP